MKPTLKQFKSVINAIQEIEKQNDILTDILVCKDSTGWVDFGGNLITEAVKLLETSLDDKNETIQWWCWEFINDEEQKYIYENGIKYNLSDLDSLYYYMIGKLDEVPQSKYEENDLSEIVQLNSDEVIDLVKEMWEKKNV